MGPAPQAKFGGQYIVNAVLQGAQSLGSVVPTWTASGAVTSAPPGPGPDSVKIPMPPDASGGSQFQLSVTAVLPGPPVITVMETRPINIFP